MSTHKTGWMLTTGPCLWWICSKVSEAKKKKKAKEDADIIENLKKFHELKEAGIITEEDYFDLKERLKKQF